MIIRAFTVRKPGKLLDYVLRSDFPTKGDLTGTVLINLGLASLPREDRPDISLRAARQAILALAKARSDLKIRQLHLIFHPDPAQKGNYDAHQNRSNCLRYLAESMAELGLSNRVAISAFHRAEEKKVEHLHAIISLPDPLTLRVLSLHRFKQKLQRMKRRLEAELKLVNEPPVQPLPSSVSLPPEHLIDRQKVKSDRSRQRNQGWEL